MSKARDIALKALLKVNNDLAYSNITFNNLLKNIQIEEKERISPRLFFTECSIEKSL